MSVISPLQCVLRVCLTSTVAVCAFGAGGLAFAAGGSISTIVVMPNVATVNENVTLKVGITDGSYGVSCNLSWAVLDASNLAVKSGTHGMQSDANSTDFTVQFGIANPGVYTVQATGGAPTSQLTVCQGNAKTTLTVKAKAPVSVLTTPVNPMTKTSPIPSNPGYPLPTRKP